MPLFIGAGGLRILQWQPGDIGDGHAPSIANTTPGFQGASPDLYYRETPFRDGEYLYQAGTPWPMSPLMGDALPGFLYAIAGREWRIVQYGPLGLTVSGL